MDEPSLFIETPPLYRLPLPRDRESYLLMQGVGGRFSHTGDQSFAYDWAMPTGTPVPAARAGVVAAVRNEREDPTLPIELRRANYVRILHEDGTTAVYAHIDTTWLAPGRAVEEGEPVALSGNTGYSTRPHLHFHVERDGRTIPASFRDVRDDSGIPRAGRIYRGGM